MMRTNIAVLIATAAILIGCQQHGSSGTNLPVGSAEANPDSAIRTAIRAHIAHNANLNPYAFDTEVRRVTFDGDYAQAKVEFHVKNGPGVMQLTYALAKQNGAWAVIESTPMGSNFSHPQLSQTQTRAPNTATSGGSSIFHAMDNFHSRTAPPAQKRPPGHPPINDLRTDNDGPKP